MSENIKECTDCFAYRGNRCSVLIEMICLTRKCRFYKTRQKFLEDLEKYPYNYDYLSKNKISRENQCITHKVCRIKNGK